MLWVPSAAEQGDAGGAVPAVGSPAGLLPGRGRLLLQASRHASCPLCSGLAEQRRSCSRPRPVSSAFSCRPNAFQARLGSNGPRRDASVGQSMSAQPCDTNGWIHGGVMALGLGILTLPFPAAAPRTCGHGVRASLQGRWGVRRAVHDVPCKCRPVASGCGAHHPVANPGYACEDSQGGPQGWKKAPHRLNRPS